MRILITGASGYIGNCVKNFLQKTYENVSGTYHAENSIYDKDCSMFQYSVGDTDSLNEILYRTAPDIVVSCMRGDYSQQLEAHKQIGLYLSSRHSGKIIYLSSANAFDNALDRPHSETDTPNAESEYGRFKIECERLLQDMLGENAVIVRIPGVWGMNCPRLLTMLKELNDTNTVSAHQNIYVNYAADKQIAEWIQYIIQQDLTGIFHIGTDDICECAAFYRRLLAKLRLENVKIQTADSPQTLIQAVIPKRPEIPASMHICVKDVIDIVCTGR